MFKNKTPNTYLSRSGGKFRVVHGAIQICPDRLTIEEALKDAQNAKLTLDASAWDGDKGEFVLYGNIFAPYSTVSV